MRATAIDNLVDISIGGVDEHLNNPHKTDLRQKQLEAKVVKFDDMIAAYEDRDIAN
jgi:hypothetical protein